MKEKSRRNITLRTMLSYTCFRISNIDLRTFRDNTNNLLLIITIVSVRYQPSHTAKCITIIFLNCYKLSGKKYMAQRRRTQMRKNNIDIFMFCIALGS